MPIYPKPIVFPGAGRLIIRKFNPDGTLADPIRSVAEVQSITVTTTQNTSELASGYHDWPDVFDTTKSGQIAVTMKNYDEVLHGILLGVEAQAVSNVDLWDVEDWTIAAETNYTHVLRHIPKTGGKFIVLDTSGSPFVSGTGSGKYTLASSVITFSSTDAGKSGVVMYEYTATEAKKIYMPNRGTRPTLHVIIPVLARDNEDTKDVYVNIVIDRCKASGDISPPAFQREPQTWNFTLQVMKARGNNQPVSLYRTE